MSVWVCCPYIHVVFTSSHVSWWRDNKHPPFFVLFIFCCSRALWGRMYQRDALPGGHVIMLGKGCEDAALAAIRYIYIHIIHYSIKIQNLLTRQLVAPSWPGGPMGPNPLTMCRQASSVPNLNSPHDQHHCRHASLAYSPSRNFWSSYQLWGCLYITIWSVRKKPVFSRARFTLNPR